MKVITISELVSHIRGRRSGKTFLSTFINGCEMVDAIIIPNNATNGDMVKACYPNYKFEIDEYTDEYGLKIKEIFTNNADIRFDLDWWNTPYKKGGE